MTAPLFIGPGLIARTIRVPREQVAWVRYVVEAHDGLANVHIATGGTVTLITTEAQGEMLDRVLEDLCAELDVERAEDPCDP